MTEAAEETEEEEEEEMMSEMLGCWILCRLLGDVILSLLFFIF